MVETRPLGASEQAPVRRLDLALLLAELEKQTELLERIRADQQRLLGAVVTKLDAMIMQEVGDGK